MESNVPSTSQEILSESRITNQKPLYSKFTQQELPAWKPLLTPGVIMIGFMSVAVIFIPIGSIALAASNRVVEIVDRYDDACLPSDFSKEKRIAHIQNYLTDKSCVRHLQISRYMKAPVFIYYELTNFYQNHRRYVKSRSDRQLRGTNLNDVSTCTPEDYLPDGSIIVPCGLIAWSFFNDTYKFTLGTQNLQVNKKGIAWKSDRTQKFGKNVYPKNFPNNLGASNGYYVGGGSLDETIPLNENEDFLVWMRTAALPTFRKLWGRIEQDFHAGDIIEVDLQNNYNTYSFNGEKRLVLSTTTWIGGKNPFLGTAYLVVGFFSIAMAVLFFLLHHQHPRPLGDSSYLSWNRKKLSTKEPAPS